MHKRVSLVLNLADGINRRPLKRLEQLHFLLDGQACTPIYKEGGWFVLVNLAPGAHTLTVQSARYHQEHMHFEVGAAGYTERYLRLRPMPHYAQAAGLQSVAVQVMQRGAPAAGMSLLRRLHEDAFKIAEDDAAPGRTRIRLFAENRQMAARTVPGEFLVQDKAASEICLLREPLEDDCYALGAPLAHAHARGRALLAVERYQTDAQGRVLLLTTAHQEHKLLYEAKGAYKEATLIADEAGGYRIEL